jgi:hypothetical protein
MIIKRIKKSSKKILFILKVTISSITLLVNDDPICEGINMQNKPLESKW